MAGWREIIDPKSRKETRGSLTFTRRYFQTNLVHSCHPLMYEGFPGSSGSKVDSITITPLNKSNQVDQALITYSPVNDEEQQEPGTSFNDLPLTMGTGGEIFTLGTSQSDYFWAFAPIGTRAHASAQERVATGTIEITEIINSSLLDVDSSTGAFQRSILLSGRLNKERFRGLGPCNWIYDGANIERLRGSSGQLQFRMIHGFTFRLPDFPNETTQGWRLLWRAEEQQWDLLTDTPGGGQNNPIPYTSGDYGRIFTTSGVN